jgi:cytochrome c oxidase subunit I
MFKFKQRPHNLLLLTAILLFIAALSGFNSGFDIYFHGTYYVVSSIWPLTIILISFWLVYWFTSHILFSKALTWTHIILMIICSMLLVIIPLIFTYSYAGIAGAPRRYYDYSSFNGFKINENLTPKILITIFILLLGQTIFVLNLIVGIFEKVRTQERS